MTTENKDKLATTQSYPLAALDPAQRVDLSALTDELGEGTEGLIKTLFTRVKMPSGGSRAFEIEDVDSPDEPEMATSIEGVIVCNHRVNAYWKQSMEDGGDAAPDCSSKDGITGHGQRMSGDSEGEAHSCKDCPLNEFGSDASGGKACKNQRHLYILRKDDVLPLCLVLSPASLKSFETFVAKNVLLKHRRLHGIVVRVGLEKAKSTGGIEYSRATFAYVGDIEPAAAEACKAMGDEIISVVTEYTAPILVDAPPLDADQPF